MNITKKFIAAAAILAASTGAMASGMTGDTMNFQYYFPNLQSPYSNATNGSFVVGSGVEVSGLADYTGTLDVQADKIVIDFTGSSYWSPATFNGFLLSSSTAGTFGAVTIDPSTTDSSFTQSMISTTGNTLSVNWQGMSFGSGQEIVLDVTSAVPEASNTALMLAGLFVVAGVARRRRSA